MSTDVLDLVSSDEDATPARPSTHPPPPDTASLLAPLRLDSIFSDDDEDDPPQLLRRPTPPPVTVPDSPSDHSDDSDDSFERSIRSELKSCPRRPRPRPRPRPAPKRVQPAPPDVGEAVSLHDGVDGGVDDRLLDDDTCIPEPALFEGVAPEAPAPLSASEAARLCALNRLSSDATREMETPLEMSVLLLRHQKQALAWMVERERMHRDKPPGHPRGGILADDQGFGKTLSTIALMITNTPPRVEGALQAPAWGNLIVAPTSIIQQWAIELETRIDRAYRPRVLIYHGPNKVRDPFALVKYDVVITSYATLTLEYPKVLQRATQTKALVQRRPGPLFRVKWFRVVLDEAQAIKNFRGETFRACTELKAGRRWSLTGTPIQNTVDDIYSQFVFLRYFVVESYKEWKRQYKYPLEGKRSERSRNALFLQFQAVLGVVLLRRAKTDKIDGKPVIQLPARNRNVMELEFSRTEREYYKAQEVRAVHDMARFGIEEGFTTALVILLRLRQACGHPALCDWEGEREFHFSDDELDSVEVRMKEVCMYEKLPPEVQQRLRVELGPGTEVSQTCPICMDIIEDIGTATKCGHIFCAGCFDEWQANSETCPTCREPVASSYDKMSLEGVRKEIHAMDRREKRKNMSSVAKVEGNEARRPKIELKIGGKRDGLKPSDESPPKRLRRGGAGDSTHGSDSSDSDVIQIDRSSTGSDSASDSDDDMQPSKASATSTKIKAFMAEYKKIFDTTEDKVLCFSQWTRMLDLVQIRLEEDGYEYVRLDGTMSIDERTAVIRMFNNRSKCRLFLISLKAGSTGLNLTAANRVFLLDSWWNPTVEDQAIDRVHRIGQKKDVHVVKMKIKESVEDQILALQDRKRRLIDGALGVEGLKTVGRRQLTMADILGLFAEVARNVASNTENDQETALMAQDLLSISRNPHAY